VRPLDDDTLSLLLVRTLERVPALHERALRLTAAGAAPGSQAAQAQKLPFGELPWVLAGSRTVVGADSLLAWHALRLERRYQPQVAHLALCRGALEAAVTARWLVDPTTDAEDRRRRAVALWIDDFRWRDEFERRALPERPSSGQAPAIRAEAAAAGVEPTFLTMTDRMEKFTVVDPRARVGGHAIYGLLSGFAHAQDWSVLATRRSEVQKIPGIVRAKMARVQADPLVTATATMLAYDTLSAALDELEAYSSK
jgi:hypothetical protein